ncbi:MAG TPA: helix-turn-helix transcriptional regulator [Chloroflexota bacterium]
MAATEPSSFAALLRRGRQAAGLSQETLAERAGLSPRAISALENGERRAPHPDTVARLATALAGLASRALVAGSVRANSRFLTVGVSRRHLQSCSRSDADTCGYSDAEGSFI